MKARLAVFCLALVCIAAVVAGTVAAGGPNPFNPIAVMYSSDGSGNAGTFAPAIGSGGTAVAFVPTPAAMMYSSDGSGNPGTWSYCTSGCFGSANICSRVTVTAATGTPTCTNGVITLPSATASVTISSIPAGGHNLVVDVNGTGSGGADYVIAQFNADSTAGHYTWQRTGFSTSSSGSSGVTTSCQVTTVGTLQGGGSFKVLQYDNGGVEKTALGNGYENADPGTFSLGCGFTPTAAITSVKLALNGGGNFNTIDTITISLTN